MSTEPTARALVDVVTAVRGVCGIEPGVGTTLRTLDSRVRRSGIDQSHFGLHLDRTSGSLVVEVSLDRTRPIRDTVRDIQAALRAALASGAPAETTVRVRVQSLDPGAGRATVRLS